MRHIYLFVFLTGICPFIRAQQLADIPLSIDWDKHGGGQVKGDLDAGSKIKDLSWAWNSSVACFPQTQAGKFTGHHVLYSFEIPAQTEVEITVIPENKNHNMSLYAYMTGAGKKVLVPDLGSCIRCEADHKWDRPFKGRTQDHTRTVKHILALHSPYTVVIGVVGAGDLDSGAFTLQIRKK